MKATTTKRTRNKKPNLTGVAKGVDPINTGKVLIGRDYIPTQPHYCTDAELFWQGVLLGSNSVRPSASTSVKLFCRRLANVINALRFWRIK